ncbi:MAG TPA: hypothetical protein VHL34_24770 [Rhizomicrobium sp.]|nr:hypothetical protein [Rhizomicrobium sp.]
MLLVVVGLVGLLALTILWALLPDDIGALIVAAIVGLVVLYGLVRFVKWAWA